MGVTPFFLLSNQLRKERYYGLGYSRGTWEVVETEPTGLMGAYPLGWTIILYPDPLLAFPFEGLSPDLPGF